MSIHALNINLKMVLEIVQIAMNPALFARIPHQVPVFHVNYLHSCYSHYKQETILDAASPPAMMDIIQIKIAANYVKKGVNNVQALLFVLIAPKIYF